MTNDSIQSHNEVTTRRWTIAVLFQSVEVVIEPAGCFTRASLRPQRTSPCKTIKQMQSDSPAIHGIPQFPIACKNNHRKGGLEIKSNARVVAREESINLLQLYYISHKIAPLTFLNFFKATYEFVGHDIFSSGNSSNVAT